MTSPASEVFSRIYRDHEWGGTSKSGPGSDPELLRPYLDVLKAVIAREGVTSVVDIGCGDWATSRTIDWGTTDYTGIDVVPELIDRLNTQFGTSRVRFLCRDFVRDELPAADLCIVKDVLQHLSTSTVHTFLRVLQQRYKLALITNDASHSHQLGWRWWTRRALSPNVDVADGGYRPLQLISPPFNLDAERLCAFSLKFPRDIDGQPRTLTETKEMLLWRAAR